VLAGSRSPDVVVHRVVHGGARHAAAVLDDTVLGELRDPAAAGVLVYAAGEDQRVQAAEDGDTAAGFAQEPDETRRLLAG